MAPCHMAGSGRCRSPREAGPRSLRRPAATREWGRSAAVRRRFRATRWASSPKRAARSHTYPRVVNVALARGVLREDGDAWARSSSRLRSSSPRRYPFPPLRRFGLARPRFGRLHEARALRPAGSQPLDLALVPGTLRAGEGRPSASKPWPDARRGNWDGPRGPRGPRRAAPPPGPRRTLPGRRHQRFAHLPGRPGVRRRTRRAERARASSGCSARWYEAVDLDAGRRSRPPAPAVVEAGRPGPSPRPEPELVVLPEEGGYALCWRLRAWTDVDVACSSSTPATASWPAFSDLKTQSAVGLGTGVLGDHKKVSANPRAASSSRTTSCARRASRPSTSMADLPTSSPGRGPLRPGPGQRRRQHLDRRRQRRRPRLRRLHLRLLLQALRPPRPRQRRHPDPQRHHHPVNRRGHLHLPRSTSIIDFYLNAFYSGDGIMVYGEGLPEGHLPRPALELPRGRPRRGGPRADPRRHRLQLAARSTRTSRAP